MFNKILLPFLILLLLPLTAIAQEVIEMNVEKEGKVYYLHNGKFTPKEVVDNYKKPHHNDNLKRNVFGDIYLSPDDTPDTLGYRHLFSPPPNSNFGFFGQDRMIQWFVAPADMRIISAGVMCVAMDDTTTSAELKLVMFDWTADEIANLVDFPTRLGWYVAEANGYNDITAYLDDPDRTGDWVDTSGLGVRSPFGNDLWSDGGEGFAFVPVIDVDANIYNWIPMSLLGEPEVFRFDVIGVSTKNLSPTMDVDRIGWFADDGTGLGGAFKFYTNGRSIAPPAADSDEGWWAREFIWDYVLAVVLTGDTPPDINDFTKLPTTLDTGPRTVDADITDINPSGGPFGVATAVLNYSIDGGVNWVDLPMSGSEPNYTVDIPGQVPGTEVSYKITATDVEGNISVSLIVVYNIFLVENTNLIVFNGYTSPTGYTQDYYFGANIKSGTSEFANDIWSYDALTAELVNSYNNIFEFCTAGPKHYNDDVIRTWLGGDAGRNYYLAGQEWLGSKTGFADSTYVPGDFEYDILGIEHSYNDVSYDGAVGQAIPSLVMPLTGTMFGGPLLTLFNGLTPPADSMMYNPTFELSGISNWIDAFDVVSGVEVDMNTETRGIEGLPNVQTLPTMAHHELTAGNKIVFAAYDPLSLNTADDGHFPYYSWVGYDEANSPFQALAWFGIGVGVEQDDNLVPEEFSMSQNYPNPFNPSTTIKFSIPEHSNVVIKVYDILGSEVTKLVNETLDAGNYTINFDASQFASGMYIYTLTSGNFTTSKKMMLMK